MSDNNQKYLLLLKNPNAKNVQAAFQQARELNLLVLSRYNNEAIVVLGSDALISALFKTRLFSYIISDVVDRKTISSLHKAQQKIVEIWNFKFSKAFLEHQKTYLEKSKGKMEEKDMPAYFSQIDPSEFIQKVEKLAKARNLKPIKEGVEQLLEMRNINLQKGGRKLIVGYLKKRMGPRFSFHFTGIVYNAPYASLAYFLEEGEWEPTLFDTLQDMLNPEVCRKLHGQISIGLIFVNSSLQGGPVISTADQSLIESSITSGLDWLIPEHPSGNLSFVYDTQVAVIDVADQGNSTDGPSSGYDSYWRNPALPALGFTQINSGIDAYKSNLITSHGSDDAVVFYITKYGSSWHGYSSGEDFISLSKFQWNWDANGARTFTSTAPHELLHQFGAADEYDADVASCDGNCDDPFGCDNIPNGNCVTCANPTRSCVMKSSYSRKICQYTRGQIGWSDIFVELTTDNESYSGTTDSVFLDIGHKVFELDFPNKRDRRRTYKEGYAIWDTGSLDRNQIKRILIRKEDGNNGWKLEQVRVFHDGDIICDDSPEKWLKDFEQFHLACDLGTGRQIVHKLELRVKTADVANAGTDKRVTLTLANREWRIKSNTNDFGRGLNQVYNLDPTTGLRIADLSQLFISKESSTIGGRWKLEGLELIVNDLTIYENNNINEWLDNSNLNFSETINPPISI